MNNERRHRVRVALTALLGAVALVTAGCGTEPKAARPSVTTTVPVADPGVDSGAVSVAVPGSLAADFTELQQGFRGSAGLAIMPVGGKKMVTFGNWSSGPAWSTIKVPLAIAALRNSASYATYASAAITASDNGAADTLWDSLGGGAAAAQAVQNVLREGGDIRTTVPTARTRADASIYGQAEWTLADQVRFASQLPCIPQSERVVGLMQQIIASHHWGLGAFGSAEFKGGWGPDPTGKYLVRQFGLIDSPSGRIAIAFAAQPDSGGFSDGMAMLDKMATLISGHLSELAGGHCS
ncbi:hypothetical protein AB0G00_11090 [Nocardia salmonicida]|uniref:hypothetical protein n=1 Tax=Nocardia TaxID=1817 RepID=UPI00265AA008|nr:hypothetical protein [Nocardia sp. PE-7]WKG08002.1 hypothetical protein QX204_23405 [Nocardia sp. PE-7]